MATNQEAGAALPIVKRLFCNIFHKRWHRRSPGGIHCYDCECFRCGRRWTLFID
jgi:hypothetical protein